jgi:hypothetical protein
MSEKKKPWSVRAVYGRRLEDVAANLEDQLNKFEEDGVPVSRIDEVESDNGFGYIVIGRRPDTEETPEVTIIPLERLQQDLSPKPITGKFLAALAEGLTRGDWASIEERAPKMIPAIVTSFTSADITVILEDLDTSRKAHLAIHSNEECPVYKALTTISKVLKDRINLHIS